MFELNVITPVSRPQLLPRIEKDLRERFSRIRPVWYCVFDSGIYVPPLPVRDISVGFWGSTHVPNSFGGPARNRMLDIIKDGWVYFLDDDNTIHPSFEEAFLEAIKSYPRADWFIFNQVRADGTLYLPATETPKVNHVDTGQCVLRRERIGNLRFNSEVYYADGLFYETLALSGPPVAISKDATYYNALR